MSSEGLDGTVDSAIGRLLQTSVAIDASDALTNAAVTLPARSVHVLERIAGGVATLRAEVPADMPCGGRDQGMKATEATPRYRVSMARLFDGAGKPLLRPAYPRGC